MANIILLVVATLLFLVVIYLDARAGIHLTFIPEGEIIMVTVGESLVKVRANIRGMKVDETSMKIAPLRDTDLDPRYWWERRFGIYFVSLLYPLRKVHRFRISADRIKDSKEVGNGEPLEDWIEHDEYEVSSLRWQFPRPFLIKAVELRDRLKINVLVYMIFEIVDPYLPVFVFKGKFFSILAAAVESAVIDYCREHTYTKFVEEEKGKGSTFTARLLLINNEGAIDDAPDGIIEAIGIKAVDGYVVKFDLDEDDEVKAATQAREVKKLIAEGVMQEAMGVAKATREKGEAESDRALSFVEKLVSKGVAPDEAARLVSSLLRTENLPRELQTLVDGGGALPTVTVDRKGSN